VTGRNTKGFTFLLALSAENRHGVRGDLKIQERHRVRVDWAPPAKGTKIGTQRQKRKKNEGNRLKEGPPLPGYVSVG